MIAVVILAMYVPALIYAVIMLAVWIKVRVTGGLS